MSESNNAYTALQAKLRNALAERDSSRATSKKNAEKVRELKGALKELQSIWDRNEDLLERSELNRFELEEQVDRCNSHVNALEGHIEDLKARGLWARIRRRGE